MSHARSETKYKLLYFMSLSEEGDPPMTTTAISKYSGVSRNVVSATISRWFALQYGYLKKIEIEVSDGYFIYDYKILQKGRRFVEVAPKFLNTERLRQEMVSYQISSGILQPDNS